MLTTAPYADNALGCDKTQPMWNRQDWSDLLMLSVMSVGQHLSCLLCSSSDVQQAQG